MTLGVPVECLGVGLALGADALGVDHALVSSAVQLLTLNDLRTPRRVSGGDVQQGPQA